MYINNLALLIYEVRLKSIRHLRVTNGSMLSEKMEVENL